MWAVIHAVALYSKIGQLLLFYILVNRLNEFVISFIYFHSKCMCSTDSPYIKHVNGYITMKSPTICETINTV